jgi:serine/threonine-protein kinase HipA
MTVCRICLEPTTGQAEYHPSCIERLFGTAVLPNLDFELSELYAVAAQMAGKMSISGMQEKISLKLSDDKSKLDVAETGGRFILKPEPARYSSLPQNEHVTMRLASLVEIETPPFGLLSLKDKTLAYIVKRFDRLDDGSKLQVEDFCQLDEKPLRDKYNGSGELCVRILRKYATEPLVEILKLYRLLLFGWWVSNGDMHLKNLSLLMLPDKTCRLSPAYDLVCTKLVLPNDDTTALSIGGKKKNLTRKRWLEFAKYCRIPERAAERVITDQAKALDLSVELIRRSFLQDKKKEEYEKLIRENTATLVTRRE